MDILIDFLSCIIMMCIFFVCLYMVFISSILMIVPLLFLYSIFSVIFFILHGAFDVALTEAAVGVFLSSFLVFFSILIIKKYTNKAHSFSRSDKKYFMRFLLLSIPFVALFALLPDWSVKASYSLLEHREEARSSLNYDGQKMLHLSRVEVPYINNPVTTILVYFRGFDTLGEIFVILIGCLGMLSILRIKKIDEENEEEEVT